MSAGLDPNTPHSLISPLLSPFRRSGGRPQGPAPARSHLFPISPFPLSADGQKTTSQARGKALRQDRASQEGMKEKTERQIGGETEGPAVQCPCSWSIAL